MMYVALGRNIKGFAVWCVESQMLGDGRRMIDSVLHHGLPWGLEMAVQCVFVPCLWYV